MYDLEGTQKYNMPWSAADGFSVGIGEEVKVDLHVLVSFLVYRTRLRYI